MSSHALMVHVGELIREPAVQWESVRVRKTKNTKRSHANEFSSE